MATKAKPQNHQNHGVGQLVFARLSVSSLNQGQGPPFAIQDQSKTNPGPQRHHGKYPSTTVESPSLVLAARNFHSLRLFSSHIFGTTGAASILAFWHPLGGSLNCYPYLFSDLVGCTVLSSHCTEIHEGRAVSIFLLKRVHQVQSMTTT